MSGGDFYRLLFKHGDVAVMVLDPSDLGIRWASPTARRLFGAARRPLPDLVAADDAPVVGTFLQAAVASKNGASRCTCAIPVDGSADRRVDLVARDLTAVPEVCGLIPASSGKTTRHRLNPNGNRDANRTLHMIARGVKAKQFAAKADRFLSNGQLEEARIQIITA